MEFIIVLILGGAVATALLLLVLSKGLFVQIGNVVVGLGSGATLLMYVQTHNLWYAFGSFATFGVGLIFYVASVARNEGWGFSSTTDTHGRMTSASADLPHVDEDLRNLKL